MSTGMHARAAPGRMRPRVLVGSRPELPRDAPTGTEAVVVGAGVAGVSAAVVLAERGVRVTLLESAPTLGGRLGAWPHTLPDGTEQVVEHGFHAFFRHYYTWRAVLRRIDPELGFLRPVDGYPVISRSWPPEDLTGLPAAPPLNLLALFARSPSLGLRDLLGSDRKLATQLLAYDPERTTARFDEVPAAEFLAALRMSDRAQAMLFEAFARSFFARPAELSAGELIAMFHYYFLGNPEGIGFDAPDTDYLSSIWDPFARFLDARGTTVRTGSAARSITPDASTRWRIELGAGRPLCTGTWCSPWTRAGCGRCSPPPPSSPPRHPAGRAGRGVGPGTAVRGHPALAGSRRGPGTAHLQRGQPGADARLGHRLLAVGTPVGALGRAHRRIGRRAALLRLRRTGRRHRDHSDARRAGRALAGDRVGPGRARPAAHGGHGAELPAGQRRHPTPGARGRTRTAPGRRLRAHAVPDRVDGTAAASGVLAANDVLAEVGAAGEMRGIAQRGLFATSRRGVIAAT